MSELRDTPEVLSHSEQRIIDYLRQGVTDAEMAVRLEMSVGDLKDRIDRLIRRLGAGDRAGLVAWRPAFSRPDAGGEGPSAPSPAAGGEAESPVGPATRGQSGWLFAAGGLVAGVALVAGSLVIIGRGGSQTPDLPTATSTAQASEATPTPSVGPPKVAGFLLGELVFQPVQLLPSRTGFVVASGPAGGSTWTAIQRVWRDLGMIHTETVFGPDTTPGIGDRGSIVSATADGERIVLNACVAITCRPGLPPTDNTVIFESRDRGATWSEVGTLTWPQNVVALAPPDRIIVSAGLKGSTPFDLRTGEPVRPPTGPEQSPRPLWLEPVGWAWLGGSAGQFLGYKGGEGLAGYEVADAVGRRGGGGYLWLSRGWLVESSDLRGVNRGFWTSVPGFELSLGGELAPGLLFANAIVPGDEQEIWPVNQPVIIDLSEGSLAPIEWAFAASRADLLAGWTGPMVEVNTPPDDCLNVRAAASLDAEIFECVRHRTILEMSAGPDSRDAEGNRWLRVRLPDGRWGYARADYLIE